MSKVVQLKDKNHVHYKKPPSDFGVVKQIRLNLIQKQRERRKNRRTKDFEKHRIIASPCSVTSQKDKIRTKLTNWKENQMREKKAKESQKKPPFVVGIVHHHIYSPISTNSMTSRRKKKPITQEYKNVINSDIIKKITKATEKRLQAKMAKAEIKQEPPTIPTKTKASTKSDNKIEANKSFAPSDYKFKPPAGLSRPKISFKFEEEFTESDSLKENNVPAFDTSMETANQKFACNFHSIESITLKIPLSPIKSKTSDFSGKMQTNSRDNNDIPLGFSAHMLSGSSERFGKKLARDDITNNSNVPVEEIKYSIPYFKCLLYKEENRLQKLCEKWMEIQSQTDDTEDIYRINQAIGQTTMLMKHKFKQFYDLILDCERKDGDVLVTCMDLHGFWDMIYLQVKDCDSRFAKLEELRAKCWQEDQSLFAKSGTKKMTVTKKKVTSVNHNLLKEITEIQDNDKNLQEMINMNNEFNSSYDSNKTIVNISGRSSNVSRNLKVSNTNYMHTSTPFSVDTKSNTLNRLDNTLIAMKVSQSIKKILSNKNLETKSLGRGSRHPNINKIVKSSCEISKNNWRTPRSTSLSHVVKNINFDITPSTDRVSKRDRTVFSDSTSKINRKMKTTFSNKKDTN